jgi:hypothetical protein
VCAVCKANSVTSQTVMGAGEGGGDHGGGTDTEGLRGGGGWEGGGQRQTGVIKGSAQQGKVEEEMRGKDGREVSQRWALGVLDIVACYSIMPVGSVQWVVATLCLAVNGASVSKEAWQVEG